MYNILIENTLLWKATPIQDIQEKIWIVQMLAFYYKVNHTIHCNQYCNVNEL